MLPVFFAWNWEMKYRKAVEVIKRRAGWEAPSYGLSADEWPAVPGQERPQAFPKLRLVASGGEFVSCDHPDTGFG
ncbi:hypothetical protein [Streptomyces cacaoi]|uniref:hypothetical protein n=1 Tax=Streptomyces cacaoi TaxID=1898 RepID=UPI0011F0AAF5|nr:hypothetical protein [Streptomyces cacaoi]